MKQEILKVATQLFLKYGLKSVSMDDIAKAAGISKKTIYQNIEDKKTLVYESLIDFIKEDKEMVLCAINRDDCNALEKMIIIAQEGIEMFKKIKPTVLYDLQKYYRQSWEIVQQYHFEFMFGIIKQNILEGQLEKVYREDADADVITKLFIGKMIMLADEEQFPNSSYPKPALFAQQLMYHLYGVVSHKHYPLLEKISTNILQQTTLK